MHNFVKIVLFIAIWICFMCLYETVEGLSEASSGDGILEILFLQTSKILYIKGTL
jgi:hypothetical protein